MSAKGYRLSLVRQGYARVESPNGGPIGFVRIEGGGHSPQWNAHPYYAATVEALRGNVAHPTRRAALAALVAADMAANREEPAR